MQSLDAPIPPRPRLQPRTPLPPHWDGGGRDIVREYRFGDSLLGKGAFGRVCCGTRIADGAAGAL